MAIMPMMGLMMQSDSIRQLPEIHSRSPWSQSLRTIRRASPDLKEISSSASEKPSRQFGSGRSAMDVISVTPVRMWLS